MKASELINALQKAIEKYGDLDVKTEIYSENDITGWLSASSLIPSISNPQNAEEAKYNFLELHFNPTEEE